MARAIEVSSLDKGFTLHLRGGVRLPVLNGFALTVEVGECVALRGPSGAGKSTVLRCLYGNYRPDRGSVSVRDGGAMVDVANASPRDILALRRSTLGYVSQFLRVVPRVGALDLVMEPARERGLDVAQARDRAVTLLERLHIPERLWDLPPATFSGGEQQRVNIARGLVAEHPILLLDEPTASLDAANRASVVELVLAAKARGATVVGIFHDREVRDAVADRVLDLETMGAAA